MNERIQDLAEHCDFYVGNEHSDKSYEERQRLWAEKFAELIVRECMTICKQHPSRTLSNNWNADAVAPDIVHRFEEHFGVEE